MKTIIRCLFVVSLYLMCCTTVSAESKFINDKLFVDAYEQPHEQGNVVFSVLTGSAIDVIQVAEDYVQIKNREDKIGWLHNKYVSNEKPAGLAFLQIQKKYELVTAELNKLKGARSQEREFDKTAKALIQSKNELGQLQKEQNSLLNTVAEKTDALEKANKTIVLLSEQIAQLNGADKNSTEDDAAENGQMEDSHDTIPTEFSLSIAWTLAALILALVSGFALGVRWLEKKINKKYNGLRLY